MRRGVLRVVRLLASLLDGLIEYAVFSSRTREKTTPRLISFVNCADSHVDISPATCETNNAHGTEEVHGSWIATECDTAEDDMGRAKDSVGSRLMS